MSDYNTDADDDLIRMMLDAPMSDGCDRKDHEWCDWFGCECLCHARTNRSTICDHSGHPPDGCAACGLPPKPQPSHWALEP